ncbi:class II aldolase/adducin-like protein [Candidatus Koribacter versatilis Ellin345]|uniref:Class II aldolase/adducin-like protein n=1 Tax=Koribacter versatilis (strain Ellin345) TaxID=204669 RepID=Q1II18_KORVE|nr:class II aldolase/adducin family protein [Candidatus Koribacter versatilis]ABF43482.1 class II aldolase/adducin-like protein [Candidatus Koribacter versatilis Ellin345]
MKSLETQKLEIVKIGQWLHTKGFVAAMDGNVSVRLSGDTVLCTPTCISKGMMEPDDLVLVDMQGKRIEGHREVSSEIQMHLLIYRMRPDVRGVVHAHPPTATGFASAGMTLDSALASEIVVALGAVPLANYGTPGTPELLEALEPFVPDHQAILMANHGAVTYAEDVLHAYMHMETVEHFAKISLVTHLLGRQELLSNENMDKLRVVRQKYLAMQAVANE